MLDGWYLIPGGAQPETAVDWGVLLKVREAVSRELEKLRRENRIGSGLAAEVRIYCDDTIREKLAAVDDELRFVLITSEAEVYPREERPEDAVEIEGFPAGVGRIERMYRGGEADPGAEAGSGAVGGVILSAAGTGARTWGMMKSTRKSAGGASVMWRGPARSAGSRDRGCAQDRGQCCSMAVAVRPDRRPRPVDQVAGRGALRALREA